MTVSAPFRPRQYPAAIVEFARRLHAAGKPVPEVYAAVLRQGYSPSVSTVRLWVDEDLREAHLSKKRRRQPVYRSATLERRVPLWEARRRRIVSLREAGLSYNAIALLANHDWALHLDDERVRRIVQGRASEATARAQLEGRPTGRGYSGERP